MVARFLELCACHQEGIEVMQDNLEQIVDMCCLFLAQENDIFQIRYPAATVLLDLTASENCIERIGALIMQKDMIKVII